MGTAIQGYGLERRWKQFFKGSVLFEDVHPNIKDEQRFGMEAGADLFLSKEHRKILAPGMVQVKASPAEALRFLQEGADRRRVIPVVVGPPPEGVSPDAVLYRLAQDFVWTPKYVVASTFAAELQRFIVELIERNVPLQLKRARWTLGLA